MWRLTIRDKAAQASKGKCRESQGLALSSHRSQCRASLIRTLGTTLRNNYLCRARSFRSSQVEISTRDSTNNPFSISPQFSKMIEIGTRRHNNSSHTIHLRKFAVTISTKSLSSSRKYRTSKSPGSQTIIRTPPRPTHTLKPVLVPTILINQQTRARPYSNLTGWVTNTD